MKVSLHPAAEHDLQEAAAFYEREGSNLLAGRFVAEFRKLTTLLARQPDIGAPRASGRRSAPMNVFPYSVVYRVDGDSLRILVVKHDRRRPGYGETRR